MEANTCLTPKCKDCDSARISGSVRCEPCGRARYLKRRSITQSAKRQQRPGYISQAQRCADADIGRAKEYTARLAKRLGLTVEQYLNAKAQVQGKLASHPAAVERRAERKKARLAPIEQANADKAKQKAALIARCPWLDPSKGRQERYRLRYRHDPEFKLKQILRAQLKKKRQGRAGNWAYSLRRALASNGAIGVPSMENFLGFTITDLRIHLEKQFVNGMTWQRFLKGDIHLDHIRPLASFDLFNDDDVRQAWAITNLRPMWAVDNIKKGAKVAHLL